MSLVADVNATAALVQSVVSLAQNGKTIVEFVEKSVKQVEAEAKENIVDGDSKFEIVVEWVKAFVDVMGEDWDLLKDKVQDLIDNIVETYNDLGLFSHTETSDGE